MDFSSSSSSLPGGGLDANKKEQLMEQLKAQLAAANAQELLQVRVCLRMSIWILFISTVRKMLRSVSQVRKYRSVSEIKFKVISDDCTEYTVRRK